MNKICWRNKLIKRYIDDDNVTRRRKCADYDLSFMGRSRIQMVVIMTTNILNCRKRIRINIEL